MATDYLNGELPVAFEEAAARLSLKETHCEPDNLEVNKEKKNGELKEKCEEKPQDRYYFILFVISLMGLVHFLPMSFFTTANEYWMYKFRNATLNTTDANERTYLQKNFISLTGIYNSIPPIIINLLSTFVSHKISAKTRVVAVLLLHTGIFGSLVVFAEINTDEWQETFFVITVISMMLVICTIQLLGAAELNLVTKLPPIYIKWFLNGEGVASIFTACVRLISIFISPSTIGSAVIYFASGTFLLLLNVIFTAVVFRMKFFAFYTKDCKEETKEKIRSMKEIVEILKYIWPMIFLAGVVTCAAPLASIYNLVVSEEYGDGGTVWGNKYFVTVCTFLIPSFSNLFGRMFYNKLDWTCPIYLQFIIVIFYQSAFSVLICLSNARPRSHFPVVLVHDWQYALVMAAFSFVKGFVANMMAMTTLSLVPKNKIEFSMMVMFFIYGLWMLAFSPLGLLAVRLL
ncbi:equilibrative nucleoside transporter 3-like [Euwallacea fornicatus]|uniref:equilibrative nucleoside transporter 3-like n=1 Tax=Euwallacea fornicatus TaxID=995702 RepID=UPI00338FD9BD